ncbi:MAG: hypothetical protein GC203_03065 [Phenylobacterium sp.]|uniref:hypothetical protein n=1 Tax=Phenylobacterium sp. TaxID=1871053 RepID=UPI0025E402C2|nr:hypothetical protein [Phenylobacterium sp.]MBI1196821.1 hypothetical protein [Phenylobacterium sp.]
MRGWIIGAAAAAALAGPVRAEDIVGDWIGKVTAPGDVELTIAVHVARDGKGGYGGYAESPDQVVMKIPMTGISGTDDAFAFEAPAARAAFSGKWDAGAAAWVGTFTQNGVELPLTLARGVVPPRPVVAGLDGDWAGVLAAPQGDLHLLLRVKTDAKGTLALFESPDQSPMQMVAALTHVGDEVTVTLKGVGGFSGRLSADGQTLEGQWRQAGGSLPLTLKKGG